MQFGLLFTTSPWFTLLCVVVGAIYAWLFYSPLPFWSRRVNWCLACLRGTLVALICFILLAPRIKSVDTIVDKAKFVVAVDNSESVGAASDSAIRRKLGELTSSLVNAGYETSVVTLSGSHPADSLRFDQKTTNLSGLLRNIRTDFEGRNLTDVILLTDGIVNEGASPVSGVYPFRIHTLGVGDTVPSRDIRIKEVRANQVAFLGNQFPVEADIAAYGMKGQQATLTLRHGSRKLAAKTISITGENHFETVEFLAAATEKGMQRYVLELETPGAALTRGSNRRDVYVEVIDGRENVLLLALSPHPDLKAIRSILSRNQNYELDVHMLSRGPLPAEMAAKKYDLLILHQLPDALGIGNSQVMNTLTSDQTPTWFIYGSQSAPVPFNQLNQNVVISGSPNQYDQVTGRFNKAFNALLLDADRLELLEKLPPMSVPFGDFRLAAGTEAILYQRIGSLNTQKPLLTVNLSGGKKKTAALLGDGLWLWRQEESFLTGETAVVDELVLKLVQLLAIKEDKRKFRVTATSREFSTAEPVSLQTEVYNDVYEKIYGQDITLKVTDESNETRTYTYTNTEGQPLYRLSGLKEGVYRFTASTSLKGKTEQVDGQFLVRDQNFELANLTADHGMLRELSAKTGGTFLVPDRLGEFAGALKANKVPDRLESTEEVLEIIHLKWLFFLLVLLAALEWATRKYVGGY
ncbi:hypothetical protein GCM10023091_38230 [Ravibacter arvi]|uniref:VWA domain-containing protein n=1 Tax=Ravibacter arvi TaxID=2051041 RepID=A0ABP8M7L9_9BACT